MTVRRAPKTKKLTRKSRGKHRTTKAQEIAAGTPISLVVRKGDVSKSVKQLIQDLRRTLLPLTINNVKENRTNVVEDFISVAGPLGVSHLFAISQRGKNVYLRLAKMPAGATLTFQLLGYSLMSDVRQSQAKSRTTVTDYQTSPLLALNGFKPKGNASGDFDERSVELMRQIFVSMFPAIDIREVTFDKVTKRVVLFYHSSPGVVEMRQYAIIRDFAGASEGVAALYKKTVSGRVQTDDIQDLAQLVAQVKEVKEEPLSDDEQQSKPGVVSIKSNLLLPKSKNANVEKRRQENAATLDMRVSLVELGPRISMKLVRVQSGVCKGDLLYEDPNIGSRLQHFGDIEDVEQVPFKGRVEGDD